MDNIKVKFCTSIVHMLQQNVTQLEHPCLFIFHVIAIILTCDYFRYAENISYRPQRDRFHIYTLQKLNHSRKPANGGWKFHHPTSCIKSSWQVLFLTPYNPIEPHHSVTLSSGNFSSVSRHIEVRRVTLPYLLGDGNFTTSQHTKIARRKSTAAKVASELAEYFAAEYRNCRSPIALSQFLVSLSSEMKRNFRRNVISETSR